MIEHGELLIDVLIFSLRYHEGHFSKGYIDLQSILPFEKISSINSKNGVTRSAISKALLIYLYEGKAFEVACYLVDQSYIPNWSVDILLFELGQYTMMDQVVTIRSFEEDFFSYERDFNIGAININELDTHINSVYKKELANILQLNYIKSKAVGLDRDDIKRLVTTNPYTEGLKALMYAFIEKDILKAKNYYVEAVKKLEHIKYYYVEAIYYFAKHLKSMEDSEYPVWLEKGSELASKYCYQFHQHRFGDLRHNSKSQYDEKNYGLPKKLDFDTYIEKVNEDVKKQGASL